MLRGIMCSGLAATIVMVVFLATGCSRGPARLRPPSVNPAAAGREAMRQYDLDNDGKIAGEELEKAPALKAALPQLDADGDGAVSADEIAARVRAWQDSRIGRMSVVLTILANGKPLEGATVTLDPEEFLGAHFQPATGKTDANGLVMPSVAIGPNEPPGVAPGFYLVRVTKEGATIPPKYNTETVLGLEIAQDVMALGRGIVFDLR